MIEYHLRHDTRYDYTEPVSLCQNLAHLKPRAWPHQWSAMSHVRISPQPAVIEDRPDYFGNPATYFTVQEPHRSLVIQANHRVSVDPPTPPDPASTPAWEAVRTALRSDRVPATLDAYQYTFDSPYSAAGPEFAEYAAPSFPPGRPVLEAALDLTRRIHAEFQYDPKATTVATPTRDVLAQRCGVCQDFAHLQIACLRSLGLAARYVSGYLSTLPPPGRPKLIGADATHAWVSVYCGDVGWVDLDPTNDTIPGDRHILLAWGRDFDDVSPVKGIVLGGGEHTVTVAVDVEAVGDTTRT